MLCGIIVQGTKSTQTKHVDCPQFHRKVRQHYSEDDNNIIHASLGPQIVTINSDSNEPTMLYGFGRQLPNTPPSLNDLNLPPNPFNIRAKMVLPNPTAEGHDENYSPQSLEHSESSP